MMPDDLLGLFLLMHCLQLRNEMLGRQTLVPFAELKLPNVARNYERLVADLVAQDLAVGNADAFTLTDAGQRQLDAIARQYSLNVFFYNAYYQAVLHSRAHSIFCERVYGKDLSQHGMTDMAQIETLMQDLRLRAGMRLLDFGCGDGRIAEHIADTTHTLATGIDIADQAIALAQTRTAHRTNLRFVCVNIEASPDAFAGETFDGICAMDSIFFVRDLRVAAEWLYNHLAPDGKMALFFHAPPGTRPEQTALAQALTALGLSFCARDLSAQNVAHWQKKKQVLLELEPMFAAEDNLFLYKNRLAECNGWENATRFSYLVEKT